MNELFNLRGGREREGRKEGEEVGRGRVRGVKERESIGTAACD